MAGTSLIFGRERIDIGVRVKTFEDPDGFSFYTAPPGSRERFHKIDLVDVALAGGSRKDKINKLVIHHDGNRNSLGCFQTLLQRELSTHMMIDDDGTVYQALDLNDVAYHAADANGESFGLDMNNPIRPELCHDPDARRLFKGTINGGPVTSVGYTDAQYEALIAVINGLCKAFPKIQPIAPIGEDGHVLRQKLVDQSFAGIVGHWHVSASKWDPGPGFDWERVLIGIRGKRMFFPVTLPGTRNLAYVPKAQALKEADAYFRNTETGNGGYFPVGLRQAWHTGVHLHVDAGTPVYAPLDGRIKVARQMDLDRPGLAQGSPNMVLVEHEIPIGGSPQKCWTVIMHLAKETLGRDSAVPWIQRLFQKEDEIVELTEAKDDRLPSSPGRQGLIAGRAALLDEPVKAGEIIGHTGKFNPNLEGGRAEELVDIALISAKPLVDPNDPTFEVDEEDTDPDILCNARSVWKRFTTKPDLLRGLVNGSYPLAPADISDFFAANRNAEPLRRLIPKHVTEWSDQTDFSGLAGDAVDFEWSQRKAAKAYLARIGPYLWWDEGVTKHVGLPDDRVVYAHHPIELLAVLSMGEARRALQPGDSGPEKGLEGDALRKARADDAAADEKWGMQAEGGGGSRTDDITGEIQDMDQGGDQDPERAPWTDWEPGEWEPEGD
jgi:N-acetyl-anhydromuramyl-L-alanine amidase AmpD